MVQTFSDNKYIYSVDMMFVYLHHHKHTIIKAKVSDFLHQLEYNGWGNPAKKIKFSPAEVIKHPKKYKSDYERILKANLNYPVIIDSDNDIVDGMHRLSKAYLQGKKFIRAYYFNRNLMKKFIIGKKGEWDKIDNMKFYELMDIYLKRFCPNC